MGVEENGKTIKLTLESVSGKALLPSVELILDRAQVRKFSELIEQWMPTTPTSPLGIHNFQSMGDTA
jgi:hypothetical protein